MLLVKDEFSVFVEKGKVYLKVDCFVMLKGKRLTVSLETLYGRGDVDTPIRIRVA